MAGLKLTPHTPGVEIAEGYLSLDATPGEKRRLRESFGRLIAAKIAELDAFEMVPGPDGVWVLRCRLVIHFSGVAAKPVKEGS